MTRENRQSNQAPDRAKGRPAAGMQCEQLQPLLTAYMQHELGESRSALVREHLRKCPDCQAAAQELHKMFDMLAGTMGVSAAPARLSALHREKIRWAYLHPVTAWLEVNHALVAVVIAALLTAVGLLLVARFSNQVAEYREQGLRLPDAPARAKPLRLDPIRSVQPDIALPDELVPAEPPLPTAPLPRPAVVEETNSPAAPPVEMQPPVVELDPPAPEPAAAESPPPEVE